MPLSLVLINFLMMGIYYIAYTGTKKDIPFHESFAYPTMLVAFFLSLFLLAFLFSKSINSLLNKINVLNITIRNLASDEKTPNKLDVNSDDEIGALIRSVNLLIERTTYRELELKQQEEIKKELLTKLRHDINTPLTAIRLQLFYLEGKTNDQALILESIDQQVQYVAELTNEFNLHSTDSLDNSYIVNDEVNMNELLGSMVKKWGYLYSIQNIELTYSPVGKDLIWTSNVLWLQRLFDNIFQNTLKHSKAKKLEVIIDHQVVSIRDNGIGFDMNRNNKGLGLKIIEDIANVLKIQYTLQSNIEGTLFCFTIEDNP
ncbi:signal transduction histidine kinase [Paenibacillus sp. DS2015]